LYFRQSRLVRLSIEEMLEIFELQKSERKLLGHPIVQVTGDPTTFQFDGILNSYCKLFIHEHK
jgi:hypothetical protein